MSTLYSYCLKLIAPQQYYKDLLENGILTLNIDNVRIALNNIASTEKQFSIPLNPKSIDFINNLCSLDSIFLHKNVTLVIKNLSDIIFFNNTYLPHVALNSIKATYNQSQFFNTKPTIEMLNRMYYSGFDFLTYHRIEHKCPRMKYNIKVNINYYGYIILKYMHNYDPIFLNELNRLINTNDIIIKPFERNNIIMEIFTRIQDYKFDDEYKTCYKTVKLLFATIKNINYRNIDNHTMLDILMYAGSNLVYENVQGYLKKIIKYIIDSKVKIYSTEHSIKEYEILLKNGYDFNNKIYVDNSCNFLEYYVKNYRGQNIFGDDTFIFFKENSIICDVKYIKKFLPLPERLIKFYKINYGECLICALDTNIIQCTYEHGYCYDCIMKLKKCQVCNMEF